MGIVLAVLISMGQVGYHNLQNKQTNNIIFAFVHTANGLEGHLGMVRSFFLSFIDLP